MSIRVLVTEYPHRTLALSTESHTLLFKHTHTLSREQGHDASSSSLPLPNAARKSDTPRCMVEFAEKSTVDLKGFRTLSTAKGTLGLITLNNDAFICVVTGSTEVAMARPGETVQKIFAVEFFCLNRSDYDHGQGFDVNPYPGQTFSSDDSNHGGSYDQSDGTAEHPFTALKKLLSGGNFYYSLNFDLTRRLQDRSETTETVDIASLDEGLLWNSYMINPLLSFRSRLSGHEREALDRSGMLTSVIRGFAQTLTIPPSSSPICRKVSNYPASLTVISRLSARRAGTRFNSRGVDDNGNVANFVETETIFWSPTGICFSYVQIRGSIPIFWESSSSLIPGQQKIQITRSLEATQHSFDKHFERLEKTYGAIHIVNLLSTEKPGEIELSDRYRQHIENTLLSQKTAGDVESHEMLRSTEFDFHERTRQAGGYNGAQEIRPYIDASAEGFVYFLSEEVEEESMVSGQRRTIKRPIVIMQQNGAFRVNCLDCLDRTNLIQGIISQVALELFFSHRDERGNSVFWLRHSSLWADNGDALSKIYAGTGALKSSFTRHGKMSLGGLMSDARKSATRLYVNHFEDKNRQNTVDLLLGRLVGQGEVELYDPVNDWVMIEVTRRKDEFESSASVKVWVGTYNLNGRMMSDINQLRSWLPDVGPGGVEDFEVIVVGFQEIVELSPQQIMSTDPGRRLFWEDAVKQCLNGESLSEKPTQDSYVLLRSGQLVGAALMIFVRASSLSRITNVEGAIKKTGMSGMAGNKGAVAIRMDIEATPICFVTAHLAAGFGNYEERNRDYVTITSGLRFQRDRSIDDHEVVVWAGDFNYRVGLSYERARQHVNMAQKGMSLSPKTGRAHMSPGSEDALSELYDNDQLNIQMVVGNVFQFYHEGRIRFLPTYKFDLGRDDYDSSEKARIPAWTDRILWRVKPGVAGQVRQLEYDSVMGVRFSDHKPVFSVFEVEIRKVDETAKAKLIGKMYEKRLKDIRNRSVGGGGSGDEADGLGFTSGGESEDDAEDLMGYQSIQEGLPPASSDRRKWWLDGEKPVRSLVGPPKDKLVLNDYRSGNPWREGEEDDWIEVERPNTSNARSPNDSGKTAGSSERPTPPPPRRGNRTNTVGTPPSISDDPSMGRKDIEMKSMVNRNLPPAPPPRTPPGSIRGGGRLSRTASIASTATTSTMMTANSQPESSPSSTKKAPPPKPTKPTNLTSRTSQGAVPQIHRTTDQSMSPSTRSTTTSSRQPQTINSSDGRDQDSPPPPLPARTNTLSSSSVPHNSSHGNNLSAFGESAKRGTPPPPVQPRRVSRLSQSNGPTASPYSSTSSSQLPKTSSPGGSNSNVGGIVRSSTISSLAGDLAPSNRPDLPPRNEQMGKRREVDLMDDDDIDDEDGYGKGNGQRDRDRDRDQGLDKWKPLIPGRGSGG